MSNAELSQINYSDPNNFATNYISADKSTRRELIKKLIDQNPKKVALLIKTRKIAKHLKEKDVSFAILIEYENTLAQIRQPKRKGHLGAQFFSGRHYEKKIRPYLSEIDVLKKKNNLRTTALMPIIARMSNEDGRELVIEFFNQAPGRLKEIYRPLEVVEFTVAGIKKGIISKPANKADFGKKWEIVKKYFDSVYKKNLGLMFIKRAELDEILKIYSKTLWKYYQYLKNRSKETKKPKPISTRSNISSIKEKDSHVEAIPDEAVEEEKTDMEAMRPGFKKRPSRSYDRKEVETTVISQDGKSSKLEQTDDAEINIKHILIPKTGDVYNSLPNSQIKDAWLNLIKSEKVITDEEQEKIDLKIEEIRDLASLIFTNQESEEYVRQKEKYTSCLISNLAKKDNIAAKMEVINKFKNSSSNSIIDNVQTIYEILLKREEKNKLIKTVDKRKPPTIQTAEIGLDGSIDNPQADKIRETEEFTDRINKQAEQELIETNKEESEKIEGLPNIAGFNDISENMKAEKTTAEITEQKKAESRKILADIAGDLDTVSAEKQAIQGELQDRTIIEESQVPKTNDYSLDVLFEGLDDQEESAIHETLEQEDAEKDATVSAIHELISMPTEANGSPDTDTEDSVKATEHSDITTQVVQAEKSKDNYISTELNNINEIIAYIIASIDNDENFRALGKAFGGSNYLSPARIADELSKTTGSIEDKKTKAKFQDIIEISRKVIKEADDLPSTIRKITKLLFWTNNDYTDKPHIQEFLKGQIIEYENSKVNEEQLLSKLFKELEKIHAQIEKIQYLNEKHEELEYRHLRPTIETIIENIQMEIELEPAGISKEWIDSELAGMNNLDARLNWVTARRYLPSYKDMTDHIGVTTAEIEEKLEEETFTESVKANLEKKKKEGKKPFVYNNIITLTRAVLKLEGAGKRQVFIKEQEVLAPFEDPVNNIFRKQRKLLFYLMSTASDEGNMRLKIFANRVSIPIKEKQNYLKILKLSKYKDKEGNAVTLQDELDITDEHIAYCAVYILGFDKPLEKRINYLEHFRDENIKESYIKYKENFAITYPIINEVIAELKMILQEKTPICAEETGDSEKDAIAEKGAETPTERPSILSQLSFEVDELFKKGDEESSEPVSPVEVLKRIQRKRQYYEDLKNRIKKQGRERSKEKPITTNLIENIESISMETRNDPGEKKTENMLSRILAHLSSCEADAVVDIVEGTILPSLYKTGDPEVGAVLKNINQSVFMPALKGEKVDIEQIKEFFRLTEKNIKSIEMILKNINKVWHEEIKNEIKTEEKKIESYEQATATGGIRDILDCLLEIDPDRIAIVLQRDFITMADPTQERLIKKLETLKGLLNGKIGQKGVEKYFGEDAGLVKKLVKKLSEYKRKEKLNVFQEDLGAKVADKADLLPGDDTQNISEEIINDKIEIVDNIKNALRDASDFIKPHIVITKAANDEEYSGSHNREKRQKIIDQLFNEGKIFTYDNGSTYIGWGKIADYVNSKTYKNKSAHEKKLFASKLKIFVKKFKINKEKYGFLGIKNDSETKMDNDFQLLMKKIGSGVAKKLTSKSGGIIKQKTTSSDNKGKVTDVRPKRAKKRIPGKKGVQIKAPSQKSVGRKDSAPKKEEKKDTRFLGHELDKNTKAILTSANNRITKKLIQIIEITNDPRELYNWYNIYFSPSNQGNLLKLLDIFNLISKKLIDAIRNNKVLLRGLDFNRKKVMKLYEKQKKNLEKSKSKNKVAL